MPGPVARLMGIALAACATSAVAQVTFFEHEGFAGRSFTANAPVSNFDRYGFHDRAASVVVRSGWWQVCTAARYEGLCVTLQPGSYGSLAAMGLDRRISAVRPAPMAGSTPPALASGSGYDYRKRHDERTYEATVTSVHAVVGPPEQRCWVEQQTVQTPGSNMSVPAGIAGAIIGGVLGHQIGGGRGRDIATGVGAVGGAVVGANVGKNYGTGPQYGTQEIKRCENVVNQRPAYWDVTYYFRGNYHRVQLTAPPGPTILVNGRGEPRV